MKLSLCIFYKQLFNYLLDSFTNFVYYNYGTYTHIHINYDIMYICIFQNLITLILLCINFITMLTLLLRILLPCNLTLASFTSLLVATGGFTTRTFANCHKLGWTVVLLAPLLHDDTVELSAVVCWRWSDGLTAEVDISFVWTLLALEVGSQTGGTGNG